MKTIKDINNAMMDKRRERILILLVKYKLKIVDLLGLLKENNTIISYNQLYNWLKRNKIEPDGLYEQCLKVIRYRVFNV